MSEAISLDEIVFRSRNKEFGAYQLRKKQGEYTRNAFGIGVVLLVLMITGPWALSKFDLSSSEEVIIDNTEVTLTEPPPIDEKQEQPEEIKEPPPPPPRRDEVKFVPPKIVPDQEAPPDQAIAEIEKLDTVQVGQKDVEGDPNAPELVEQLPEVAAPKPVEIQEPEEKTPAFNEFVMVDSPAEPVNLDDIKRNVKYPQIARDGNIQGKVLIKILVDKEGNPKDHKVMKTPHELLTEACLKEIYKLKFKPAMVNKKPVKFWVMVPFDFRIGN